MKRLLLVAALAAAGLGACLAAWPRTACALAGCKDTYQPYAPDKETSLGCSSQTSWCSYQITKHWIVFFLDNFEQKMQPWALGTKSSLRGMNCRPTFEAPRFTDYDGMSRWSQLTHDGVLEIGGCAQVAAPRSFGVTHVCQTSGTGRTCTTAAFDGTCPSGTAYDPATGLCCSTSCSTTAAGKCLLYGGDFDYFSCTCTGCVECAASPVLVDTEGDGFALTGAAAGVSFDLDADGAAERLSWTRAGSDDAWLALDRDGSGAVESGRELFGDLTPQPEPAAGQEPNGFLALAEFDRPGRGGNADGVIDASDAVFDSLRLWPDANHDGVSQAGELHALPSLGVERLHLDYKESGRVDEHGNRFKYRAKVDDAKGAKVNRWAWDVFLVSPPPPEE
ncbi:MAG TPA: hypothetical protein VG148_12255 [Pyrinomonadaceae bacterium]|nr:hypothetical protein [Pyrinomonadaceae bacterium]